MVSNNSSNNPSKSADAKAVRTEIPVDVMDAGGTIETAATGTGNGGDPGGTDTKPPGVTDYNFDLLA